MTTPTVFIDGEAGTTGLQIADRLRDRSDLSVVSIAPDKRKDAGARAEMMNAANVVILCLPDEAAREAVTLVTDPDTVIIDASSGHRVSDGWTYGFPEMFDGEQRAKIKASKRISNPGCFPTGFISMVQPLVRAGLLPPEAPVSVNAVSGYSGGGKALIAEFEDGGTADNYRIYSMAQGHKHLPEMKSYTGLSHVPMFTPAVGRYAQGMIVEVPLMLWAMPAKPTRAAIQAALESAYVGEQFVTVASLGQADALAGLEPEACNNTNKIELFVFGNDQEARLVARYDNLGKGASGAAVQNLNIVLGLDEAAGL